MTARRVRVWRGKVWAVFSLIRALAAKEYPPIEAEDYQDRRN